MQLEIYQWVVPIIGLFFIIRTTGQYARKKRSVRNAVIWVVFWLAVMLLAIIPNQISFKIADMFGIKSNVNAIIFAALGALVFFVFYLSATIERLEGQITDLVRRIALDRQEMDQLNREIDEQKAEKDGD